MKLIRQTHLIQDRGNSRRVHEVDLCEVGEGQYVVNFRYGRAGRRMQEGSLTTIAVDRAQAEKIYRKEVRDKLKKGYIDPAAPENPPQQKQKGPRKQVSNEEAANRRKIAILARLRGGDSKYPEWPLDRAIWRAGELALEEAAPELINILSKPGIDAMRRYVTIRSLGYCGNQDCIKIIEEKYRNERETTANRRIALEALLRLMPEAERQKLIAEQALKLPEPLLTLAGQGPADEFSARMNDLSKADKSVYFDSLYTAYVIDNEYTRQSVVDFCRITSVDSDGFSVLRAFYKVAEYRFDGQIFGLLAHRFETAAPSSHRRFSIKTKNYYRWRCWRTLRRIGVQGHDAFVKMAVGALAPFLPEDSPDGSFSSFWAFNHLLYHNSQVFRPDKTQSGFVRVQSNTHTGQSSSNEEAFPELWDKAPIALLHLIDESALRPVHIFAVRALRRNTDFLSKIDDAVIVMLLGRLVEETAAFGFELFQKRGDTRASDKALFIALADSVHKPAREAAWRCIDRHRSELITDSAFLTSMAFSQYQDTRNYLKQVIRSGLLYSDTGRSIVGRLIAGLLSSVPGDDVLADVSELLLQILSSHTSSLGVDIIRDLMEKSSPRYHELAGGLLLANSTLSKQVPSDMLFVLLSGSTESVRAYGVALLSQQPSVELVELPELFFHFLTSPHTDIRASLRPLTHRLVNYSGKFADHLGELLVNRLRFKDEGDVHLQLRELLENELGRYTRTLDQKKILQLLNSRFKEAQNLGSVLLETQVKPTDLPLTALIRLVNHESRKVRDLACSFCKLNVSMLKQNMKKTIRLLDVKWDDSREFMFDFFQDQFDQADLTPEILVSICDNVRPEVKQFGCRLITRYFEDKDGPEYLQKLSEHPSPDLQLFATNFLERFAAGNIERMISLTPYFISVLSRVNTGRVAKARVLRFLEQEALKSRAAAEALGPVFARQSVTMAVENKGLMIASMVHLQSKYPDLALPVSQIDFETRSREVSDAV